MKLVSERYFKTVSKQKRAPRMGPNMGSKF
nr:MAG TPA_asm: hypothetical protein [Caudoviricetes sp.]